MPTVKFEYNPRLKAEENLAAMIPVLNHLLAHLNSKNVKRLDTNETVIKSADGSTEIVGPLLVMKDKQGVPVIRLQMGYDAASLDFVFKLLNATGDVTVQMDSATGNLTVERGAFKGSITIGTGNNVFKAEGATGIWLGHADFASAPFKVGIDGSATATNLTVVGGIIKTAASGRRIELSGNKLTTYNDSENKNGIAWGEDEGASYGDVSFFDNGTEVLRLFNNLSGYGYDIRPIGSAALGLGDLGKITVPYGNWVCDVATFDALKSSTSNYATVSWVESQGYITGYSPAGYTGTEVINGKTFEWVDGSLISVT